MTLPPHSIIVHAAWLTLATFVAPLILSTGAHAQQSSPTIPPSLASSIMPMPNTSTLWYDNPAAPGMNEALPIGNGRLGAMVYGVPDSDHVGICEDSLWTGGSNPSGNYDSMGGYQQFGNVEIALPDQTGVTDYQRGLDLATAVAYTTYRLNGVTYRREYLASHPDNVVIIHLTADKPGMYTGSLSFNGTHGEQSTAQGNNVSFVGSFPNGIEYEGQLEAIIDGGTLTASGTALNFTGCNSVTIIVAAGTNYTMDYAKQYLGDNPHDRVTAQLAAASAKPYDALKAAHTKDYQSLANRVSLDLGHSPAERLAMPTDKRKLLAVDGSDPQLESLMFQYGRYLLISCSRPGWLPANLQGLWVSGNDSAWHSDYHANINIQMNYWPAETANLSECAQPLFDLVESQLPSWRVLTAASPEFALPGGAPVRGWALRTSHNITGGMGWEWDKTANAWYCLHFWEHYAFTQDKAFLRSTAYPILKETTQFWEDHLKTLPDGRLVVPTGWSPEHGPHEDGVSYNQEIVWDLFTNYIDASTALGVDADYRAKVSAMRDKLVEPGIGSWGQLLEWMTEKHDPVLDTPNDHHRHTSHLFGIFPGRQFSAATTPDKVAAAKISLLARGDTGDVREWSFAWRTALFARMHDGDNAHKQFDQLFSDRNTCHNLFGLHPPMQIDGNFGITAAVAEMLLQSQDGTITLLPALPTAWANGSVKGLCTRGGFVVDETWADGKLLYATIHSTVGGRCRVDYRGTIQFFETKRGESFKVTSSRGSEKLSELMGGPSIRF